VCVVNKFQRLSFICVNYGVVLFYTATIALLYSSVIENQSGIDVGH